MKPYGLAAPAQRTTASRSTARPVASPETVRRETHFDWHGVDEAITPRFVAQWRALGVAATTPNIYLMPEFLLPALRYVADHTATRFAALWNADRSALLALGIFNAVAPSWRFPYPRLSAVLTKYSFQSGVLLRSGVGTAAVDQFVGGLFAGHCRAVRINEFREDSRVYQQVQDAARRLGLKWFEDNRYERAAVDLGSDARWQQYISPSRHGKLRRLGRRLADLGKVEFRIVQGADVCDGNAEALLRVEAMGWKGASALLANNERANFFREVTRACREHGFIFFCETLLDGNVIASTSNFVVNGQGFGFKIGNDPAFAKFSPGYLVQYASLQAFAAACPDLLEIESGSDAGSYIEALWPERIAIVSGHLVDGQLPAAYAALKHRIKSAGRSFAGTLR